MHLTNFWVQDWPPLHDGIGGHAAARQKGNSRLGVLNLSCSLRGSHPPRLIGLLIFASAFGFALLSARDYAGSWNDGSRLAAVQSLVDYHTFTIDRSIFVQVPQQPGRSPYGTNPLLNRFGTRDVMIIAGKVYSAKPPVPLLLRAAVYAGVQLITGLNARRNPRLFCYLMTVTTSAIAYTIAVWCAFRIGLRAGLDWIGALSLAASLALATVAIAYMQVVNDHIIVLAVASALILNMLRLVGSQGTGTSETPMVLAVGALGGFGYAVEQGSGAVLFVAAVLWTAYRTRSFRALCLFGLAGAPWVIAHHLAIYTIGRTLRPLAGVAAYVAYPGAAFTSADMTGVWTDRQLLKTIGYALGMLFGPRGFIGYNLALYLSLIALWMLIARGDEQLPEVIFAGCCLGGTWILYSLLSSNYSGVCCSVRWFVPLLAPAYYILARFLGERPGYWPDFLILSGWGILIGARIWWQGPWMPHFGFLYFPLQAAALVSWAAYRIPRCGFGRPESLPDDVGRA
jgi:hypothetical protein